MYKRIFSPFSLLSCLLLTVQSSVILAKKEPEHFHHGKFLIISGKKANQLSRYCDPHARRVNVIVGTPGNDRLRGTRGRDVIIGLGGDDRIDGLSGDDCIDGGEGNDLIIGGSGRDRLFGGRGRDRIVGRSGDDYIDGGDGNDWLRGGRGKDTLRGGRGNDDIRGRRGNDELFGGPGKDRLYGDGGRNLCHIDSLDKVRRCKTRSPNVSDEDDDSSDSRDNRKPKLRAPTHRRVREGRFVRFGVSAWDPDKRDWVILRAQGLPEGAKFHFRKKRGRKARGVFVWQPRTGMAGRHRITFQASDNHHPPGVIHRIVVIDVLPGISRPPNHAPVFQDVADQTISEEKELRFIVLASDPDQGDRLTLSTGNLPSGASFLSRSNGRGEFVWIPRKGEVGTYTVTFTAADNHRPAGVSQQTVRIRVEAKSNRPPVIANLDQPSLTEGQRLKLEVTATDPDAGDRLTLKLQGLPQGASFKDQGDGHGLLEWMPLLGQAGDYAIVVTTRDNGNPPQTVSETFNLKIRAAQGYAFGNACLNAANLYLRQVHGDLTAGCASGCHQQGGIGSGFSLSDDGIASFAELKRYIDAKEENGGKLLGKSIGRPFHAGGLPYVSDLDPRYRNLRTFLAAMPCDVAQGPGAPSVGDLVLLDNERTLRKAAIVLAGRLPTEAEIAQASSDEGLRAAVRGLMQGEGFADFIYRTANEWFLTAGVRVNGNYYKEFGVFTEKPASEILRQLYDGLPREPLELVRFIVENDRPYTEVVTADYTLANDGMAKVYGAVDAGIVGTAAEGWRPVRIPRASKDHPEIPYPHAGVLSTYSWLYRFPTTDTNRNRHRVSMMYRQFLGFDIEALGKRPGNNSDLGDFLVPVMENPACVSCHKFMDPAAGAFMDFGPDNTFRRYGDHALSRDYVLGREYPKNHQGEDWYVEGDKWYRDMFPPGFEGTAMPGGYTGLTAAAVANGGTSALSWMTRELVTDSRFAEGAVAFWFRGVFGRKPLAKPLDPSDPGYAEAMRAYEFQHGLLQELAVKFRKNGYIVRDLLVDMVMSPLFRADSVATSLSQEENNRLAGIGMERLLTPEELNALTQASMDRELFRYTTRGPGLLYGGFDGGSVALTRNQDMTPTMAVIADTTVSGMMCTKRLVREEFRHSPQQRQLLIYVEPDDLPSDAAAKQRIVDNLVYLHHKLWGESLSPDDPEIQATLALFEEVVADPTPLPSGQAVWCEGTFASSDGSVRGTPLRDSYGTLRAWRMVLMYLMTDFRYLHN